MRHAFFADRLETAATLARWYFDQWGHRRPGRTVDGVIEDLKAFQNRDRIPLILLALDEEMIVGAAQLKFQEMELFPEREHWLGGVYVTAAYRGRGIASELIAEVVNIARGLGVKVIHLQTERLDGGLYARLGWSGRERVVSHGVQVLVMDRPIA